MQLREKVFKIEQKSLYTDLDDLDKKAIHIFIKDDDNIIAYARLVEKDKNLAKLARVISRKKGLGKIVRQKAIDLAFYKLNFNEIFIQAQRYAQGFYEKLGFVSTSEIYDLGKIEHIDMVLKK